MTVVFKRKPLYQPWREEAFRGDEKVLYALNPLQRWMYRTLLQAAFICSTRPYLPDEDAELWMLAGCESRKQWDKNKDAVRSMFSAVEVDQKACLIHHKVLEDWNRLEEKRQILADNGRKGGKSQQMPSNCLADAEQTQAIGGEVEVEVEVKGSKEKKHTRPSDVGVCGQLIEFWNANRGSLPEVLKATNTRQTKVAARVKADPGFVDTFKRSVIKCSQTPFCYGEGRQGWRATFDWLIENDRNALAVLEGNYDGASSSDRIADRPPEPQPMMRLTRETLDPRRPA